MASSNAVVVIGVNPGVMSTTKSALVAAGYDSSSTIVFSLEDAQKALESKPKLLIYGPGIAQCSCEWLTACDAMIAASTPSTKTYTMTRGDFPAGTSFPPPPETMAAVVVECTRKAESK
jgi:hypothetical protein